MQLRILTWNTHLCGVTGMSFFGQGGSIFGYKGGNEPQPMTYLDDARAKLICDRINALEPDVVGLQEVWDMHLQQRIRGWLTPKYPYGFVPPNVDPPKRAELKAMVRNKIPEALRWLDLEKIVIPQLEPLLVGSGLMLFSKSPQADWGFLRFEEVHGDDTWATKGVAACTIHTEQGDLRIGISHAGTDCGGELLPHIYDIAYQTCQMPVDTDRLTAALHAQGEPPYELERLRRFYETRAAVAEPRTVPALMFGDFNVNWVTESSTYLKMNGIFARIASAHDAYRKTRDLSYSSPVLYRQKVQALLDEYRADLEGLCDPGPAVPVDSGKSHRIGIFGEIEVYHTGPSAWSCPACQDAVDAARIDAFRKRLADLTAQHGITSDPVANLLNAYFGRRCSIRYLAAAGKSDLPTRLDYVYFGNPPGANTHLAPTDVKVLTNWGDESLWNHNEANGSKYIRRPHMGQLDHPQRVDLSDHYPVLATFEVQ